jgi:hypothetical protein
MATPLQRTRVLRLYRNSLKNVLSWAVRREVFYAEVSGSGSLPALEKNTLILEQANNRHLIAEQSPGISP